MDVLQFIIEGACLNTFSKYKLNVVFIVISRYNDDFITSGKEQAVE